MRRPESLYVLQPDGAFAATEGTRGPWSPEHQHGGPPTALAVRALERTGPDAAEFDLVRLTVELLAPLQVSEPLTVKVEPTKLGARAQRFTVTLEAAGKRVATLWALKLRRSTVALPSPPRHPAAEPLAAPDELEEFMFPFFAWPVGYHTSVEMRVARGPWGEGPAAAWLRPRIPLVAGEPTSPACCVAIVADALNGVACVLDTATHSFVNPDMTITMGRAPRGEWVGLDARGAVFPTGAGFNYGALHDLDGELGTVMQSLVVSAAR